MQPNKMRLFLGLLAAVLLLSLGVGIFLFNRPTACGTGDSNYSDIWRARNYAHGVFDSEFWQISYDTLPFRIDVIWDSPQFESLVYLEYLIFNCGYTEEDLDDYFNDEYFAQIVLIDYDNPQKVGECRQGDVRLYEFRADFMGQSYRISQWVKPDNERRVAGLFMTFPLEDEEMMDSYAVKIFPELPVCP